MASTSVSDNETAGLDRLEGEVLAVGGVVRPDELNDMNDKRADAATDALALYMEHKGQTRKLSETGWKSLLATLKDINERSKPLIEEVSITLNVSPSPSTVIKVLVTGALAKEISERVSVGDRIVGEGVTGEEELLLETYKVYKLAAGSGEQIIASVEPVDERDVEETTSHSEQGEEAKTGSDPDESHTEGSQAEEPTP